LRRRLRDSQGNAHLHFVCEKDNVREGVEAHPAFKPTAGAEKEDVCLAEIAAIWKKNTPMNACCREMSQRQDDCCAAGFR